MTDLKKRVTLAFVRLLARLNLIGAKGDRRRRHPDQDDATDAERD